MDNHNLWRRYMGHNLPKPAPKMMNFKMGKLIDKHCDKPLDMMVFSCGGFRFVMRVPQIIQVIRS